MSQICTCSVYLVCMTSFPSCYMLKMSSILEPDWWWDHTKMGEIIGRTCLVYAWPPFLLLKEVLIFLIFEPDWWWDHTKMGEIIGRTCLIYAWPPFLLLKEVLIFLIFEPDWWWDHTKMGKIIERIYMYAFV